MDRRNHWPRGRPTRLACALGLALALTACSFLPSAGYRNPTDLSQDTVVPRKLPLSRYGNSPYTVNGRTYYPLKSAAGYRQRGIASWYGRPFNGQKTSDGEIYNMYAMTAANKVLPLPSYALVRNLANNRSIIVRINDRGPFYPHRIIDLSYAAAARLGVLATGTAPVIVEGLTPGSGPAPAEAPHPEPRANAVFESHQTFRRSATNVFGAHEADRARRHRGFYVQFGAFAQYRDADDLRAHLRGKGLDDLHIFPNITNGRKLYLVCMGPEPNRQKANALSSRLSHEGLGPTILVDP
ncbi:MAG TPA: septal ring lytic transglycosylase RlpA family protein [Acidiferrobacter sp.]|nr:septal ring lytic transglycosylase RlpA family protein [Acidiferrobacter sp.]